MVKFTIYFLQCISIHLYFKYHDFYGELGRFREKTYMHVSMSKNGSDIGCKFSSSLIVGFFISVSSLKVFSHSIHSERRRIYPGKSIQALQNNTIIISWLFSFKIIQPRCSGILLKLLCLFSSFLFHYKTFTRYSIIKYLINVKPITSRHKIQAKTFTWPNMSFYARYRSHLCPKQRNRTTMLLGKLWYTYKSI